MKGVLFNRILNIFYPLRCIFCGELLPVDAVTGVCNACKDKLPYTPDITVFHLVNSSVGASYSIFHYTGIIEEAIKKFKFYDNPHYAKTLAYLMGEKINNMTDFDFFDIIIPVPLHPNKQRERGYNQSGLLVRHLGRLLNKNVHQKALVRIKETRPQSLLGKKERQTNVKNAFMVKNPKVVKGKRVLLVDDIMTTGSTLNHCANAMLTSGAVSIHTIVLATGRLKSLY